MAWRACQRSSGRVATSRASTVTPWRPARCGPRRARRAAASPPAAPPAALSQPLPSGQVSRPASSSPPSPGACKTVAAGKVVQPGPGRDGGEAGAVVVAAAIVQIPAQVRVGQAMGVQPSFESDSVLRKLDGRKRRFAYRNGVMCRAPRGGHGVGKARYCASVAAPTPCTGSRPSCQWPSMNRRSCGLWHRARSSYCQRPATRGAGPALPAVLAPRAHRRRAAAGSARPAGQAMPPTCMPRLLPPACLPAPAGRSRRAPPAAARAPPPGRQRRRRRSRCARGA
jgi:hypothetical protein